MNKRYTNINLDYALENVYNQYKNITQELTYRKIAIDWLGANAHLEKELHQKKPLLESKE